MTPKDMVVELMAEEINVRPVLHALIWNAKNWPFLDGGQTQSDQGSGYGTGATGGGGGRRGSSGMGGQSYDNDNTGCKNFFFSLSFILSINRL